MTASTNLTAWLPTIVAAGALAVIWFYLRSAVQNLRAETKEELLKMHQEINFVKDNYIDKDSHVLICRNNALETKAFFNQSFTELKDAIFGKIRELEKKLMEREP